MICNRYKVSTMNPLNEQGDPIMKSYNSDPNNFQMNTILGRPSLFFNFQLKRKIFGRLFKELNQRMIFLMNMMMGNVGSSHGGYRDFKLNDRSGKITADVGGDELLELLKKTQTKVNSLENEFKKVETENLHQDQGSTNHC